MDVNMEKSKSLRQILVREVCASLVPVVVGIATVAVLLIVQLSFTQSLEQQLVKMAGKLVCERFSSYLNVALPLIASAGLSSSEIRNVLLGGPCPACTVHVHETNGSSIVSNNSCENGFICGKTNKIEVNFTIWAEASLNHVKSTELLGPEVAVVDVQDARWEVLGVDRRNGSERADGYNELVRFGSLDSIIDQVIEDKSFFSRLLVEAGEPVRNAGEGFSACVTLVPDTSFAILAVVSNPVAIDFVIPSERHFLFRAILYLGFFLLLVMVVRSILGFFIVRSQFASSKQRESLLQQLRDRAEADAEAERSRSAAKTRFISVLSHELRNPLTGVVLNADMLRNTDLSQDQESFCDGIGRATQLVLTIINDVLDLSKIEAGRMHLEEVPFGVAETLEFVTHSLGPAAFQKHLELVVDIDQNVQTAVCLGDPTRTRQIIHNLVSNAIKFTKEGRVEVRLTEGKAPEADSGVRRRRRLKPNGEGDGSDGSSGSGPSPTTATASGSEAQSTSRAGGGAGAIAMDALAASAPIPNDSEDSSYFYLCLEVEDTGIGISPEGLGRLFREFSQVDTSTTREFGGTGLGLFISKQLVTMMGGDISVSSTEGKGTTFTVHLRFRKQQSKGPEDSSLSLTLGLDSLAPSVQSTSLNWRVALHIRDARLAEVVSKYISDFFLAAISDRATVQIFDNGVAFVRFLKESTAQSDTIAVALVDDYLVKETRLVGATGTTFDNDENDSESEGDQELVRQVIDLAQTANGRLATLLLATDAAATQRSSLEARGWHSLIFRPVRFGQLMAALGSAVHECKIVQETTKFRGRISTHGQSSSSRTKSSSGRRGTGGSRRSSSTDNNEGVQKIGSALAPRILVVDDFQLMREIVSSALLQLGYRVAVATNGQECVDALVAAHKSDDDEFAAILMDCEMPVLDGFAATDKIRSLNVGKLKSTPIIAMTANALREDKARCFRSGMDAFLAKPVTRDNLKDVLEKHVNYSHDDGGGGGGHQHRSKKHVKHPPKIEETSSGGDLHKSKSRGGASKRKKRGAHSPRKSADKQLQILLCDDVELMRSVVRAALESMGGVNVTECANGSEAVDIVLDSASHFDVVLLDIETPVLNGIDAVKAIRASGRSSLMVLALTGNVDSKQEYIDAGFNDVLEKPVKRATLEKLISSLRTLQ